MKNLLVFVIFIGFLCSLACEKDGPVDHNMEPSKSHLSTIRISGLEYLVPIELFKPHSRCVFINQAGEELELDINMVQTQVDKIIDGIVYKAESLLFSYGDPENNTYLLTIEATGNYTKETHSQLTFVLCQSFAAINQGYTAFVIIDSTGAPQFAANHAPSEVLLDRTFQDVYYNLVNPAISHFSRIYYSPGSGIVAFHGFDNELWVLDSFE